MLDRQHLPPDVGSQQFYLGLLAVVPDVVFRYELRPEPHYSYVSPSAETVLGYSPAEHYADPDLGIKIVHPDDRHVIEDVDRWLSPLADPIVVRWVRRDGTTVWTEQRSMPVFGPDGSPSALVGVARDITQQRQQEARIRRLGLVLEQSPSIVVVTDTRGVIEYVNQRFEEVTLHARAAVIGRQPGYFKSGLNPPELYRQLWQTIARGAVWRGEFHNARADGTTYWERATIWPLTSAAGVVTHYVKVAVDVSHSKGLEAAVTRLSQYDPLTGLPNRTVLLDRLTQLSRRPAEDGLGIGVILLDVHGPTGVAAAWGYLAGDRVLREVATRLERVVPAGGTLAALGGTSFALLTPTATVDHLAELASSLHDAVRDPVSTGESPVHVRVSVGIARSPDDGTGPEILLQRARSALEGTASNPGVTRFYGVGDDREARDRLHLEARLRHALANDGLHVAYMPRVDLRSGRVVGLEALARWDDAELGPVAPARFIPIAEADGLIHRLDTMIIRRAIADVRTWWDAGLTVVPISVNLSGAEISRAGLVDDLTRWLAECEIPPHLLEVELTESVALSDTGHTVAVVAALRDRGIRVSIDDFGAGHASFGQLKRVPVSALKIDLSFVRDLGPAPDVTSRDAAIVLAIISLGTILGLDIVAEGIETEQQREFLRRHACGYGQGFLFSRPVPAADVPALLTKGRAHQN